MPKIAIIGAGSTVFTKNLLNDILSYPELADSEIALHDIDADRLKTSRIVANKVAKAQGVNPKITSSLDRRASLDGADYAICMIQVGGYAPSTIVDFEIPKKYGLQQTIADTLGLGGIMRGLRTIPVLLEMTEDMEELCPDVTFLNYVNPMAMNCWAINRSSKIKTVGLCHSVQHTSGQLAQDIGIPIDEINFLCAGINHMAFYLRFERDGVDLSPQIAQVLEQGRAPEDNLVRYEMFKRLGYFVTESSEHFSEYVPWFIKQAQPELIDQFNIPIDEYISRCEFQIENWKMLQELLEDEKTEFRLKGKDSNLPYIPTDGSDRDWKAMAERMLTLERSPEYGSLIIHSMETGEPRVVYGNVPNEGLIDNLPEGCCVEVPCLVDENGLQPTRVGMLPPHLAALMQTNINVQALTVEAALTRKREHIYHAAMLDPHTAADLNLDQIWNVVDDLIEAHGDWLPGFN